MKKQNKKSKKQIYFLKNKFKKQNKLKKIDFFDFLNTLRGDKLNNNKENGKY